MVSELETLAVIWAMQHFNAYLYGHEIIIITVHSVVKAILRMPSPSGKQESGSGVKKIDIVY